MKLIETPVNSNLNLENLYPTITRYVFDKKAIKYYKMYALDRTQIAYVDLFDKIVLLMINTKRKIPKKEVDCAIHRLLHASREEVDVHIGLKQEMAQAGLQLTKPIKDIVVISQVVATKTDE